MSRTRWSLAALLVVSAAAHAAEGTHPGPLPPPHDAAGGAPASPDYAYPGATAEGIGPGQAYGSAPGYGGATARYPQDWAAGQGPGTYGYPPAAGYGQRGGYGYDASPGPGATTGRGQPRGYWIWVPAEAMESTIGGYSAPQAPYGGHDYGYPAYPSYPGDSDTGGYSVPPSAYSRQGGAYPDYGSGGPPPADGWWGTGGAGGPGEAFGDPATQVGSRALGATPRPESTPAPAPRQSATTAAPAGLGTRPTANEANQPAASNDGSAGLRPTTLPEPAPGTH